MILVFCSDFLSCRFRFLRVLCLSSEPVFQTLVRLNGFEVNLINRWVENEA